MDPGTSSSASTTRPLQRHLPDSLPGYLTPASVSQPSSPRSSALPSPPDSPSSDSVSSFPSVSSSFFFSSAAASPPQSSRVHPDHARDSTQGLIIPSLTLPAIMHRPTAYGKTMGDIRLLVLGAKGAGKSFLSGFLLEENEDVIEVGTWKDAEHGKVLRASTNWIELRDAHGFEKLVPTHNVEIIELPGYDQSNNGQELIQTLQSMIQTPFYTVSDVLDPKHRPSPVVASLVSSASTPLYTALIFLFPSSPSALDHLIIDSLGPQIPIITLPRIPNDEPLPSPAKLSSFQPTSATALRTGLFHSPETLATLRSEATDRFLRWREVERTVDDIHAARRSEAAPHSDGLLWDKAKWESEWVPDLSRDVATRLREGTLTVRNVRRSARDERCPPRPSSSCVGGGSGGGSSFDPLHLPSLVMFSISLLGPLRARLGKSVATFVGALGDANVKVALLGGFCVGLGIGLYLGSAH